MFLLAAKRKFIKKMTILTVVLLVIIGLVYHLFIPDRYFPWFPAIPVYFYLFGLFYINMFSLGYRLGEDKLVPLFLVCKGTKFIVSAIIVIIYCFAVQHEVLAFVATFMVFYLTFLIFETVYFTNIELRIKKRKKLKQKQ
ncbi:MAG: hypothetical protein SOX26_14710 [Phocaeicola sp.]|nr:hypothetical protein [Phocaeicola sp.]